MSYLNSPRLTFSGQFQADPSTVNNDPNHFNNATFIPSYQEYQTKEAANGWWNPDGTGNWRFIGCTVTSVTYKDGTSTSDPKADPIIGMSIMDSDSRVSGKIVDLDSQQQMVSEIWGFIVRLVSEGKELIKGDYETAAFTNIWFNRSTDLQQDAAAGATYQSIIKNIVWDIEKTNSRYLKELHAASAAQLSIEFNVDRYNGDHTNPQFTIGRITGSIGPSTAEEPKHVVLGRQLFPATNSNCNYAVAILDEKLSSLVVDLGNAFQFGTGGKIVETRNLELMVNKGVNGAIDYVLIGKINYSAPDWYMKTSGICTFHLSPENLKLVNNFPLAIISAPTATKEALTLHAKQNAVVFTESVEYVYADKYVYRLNPSESCTVDLYSTHLGKPLTNKTISFKVDPGMFFQKGTPPVSTPEILTFKNSIPVGANGKSSMTITAGDPGNARKFIDGQVYAVTYFLNDQTFAQCNQSNFVSVLVYDKVKESAIKNPVWETDIAPIMQQYANLYPLMSKGIFNLANKEVVDSNAQILKFVFSKEMTDPNYMPATRDLSRDKKQMLLNYLDNILKTQKQSDIPQIKNPHH